jgi:nitroimidazol reductase NimA-like FMN-containing flavoprotein (pyridoxamine 5'-phosphate oxidase superfamily)
MPIDDLGDYGVSRMENSEIEAFLSEQSVGVLGLPTEQTPVMRPMSFAFEAPDRLYFVYLLPADSEKEAATNQTDVAGFLVYDAEDRYHWTSVSLDGTLAAVPADERVALEEEIDLGWRPRALERASDAMETRLYEFEIIDKTGLQHKGLPEAYRRRL